MGKILLGDCLEVLSSLSPDSVQTCITSPPYWGLRDYGTAQWNGGDPGCEHKTGRATRGGLTEKQITNKGGFGDEAIKTGDSCPRCGAIRIDSQLGLEKTPEEYVENLVKVFQEIKRVLKKDGTLWLNLGDSYTSTAQGTINSSNDFGGRKRKPNMVANYRPFTGLKSKDLVGIPWRVALALQADGWYLRQDIIWSKPNPMPESVTDRCTKSHEYIFLLSKSSAYYFNAEAIKEKTVTNDDNRRDRETTKLNNTPGRTKMKGLVHNNYDYRNKRSVWEVGSKPYKQAHFATYPEKLIKPMVLAGCPENGTVLDPFFGSGTTGVVAKKLNRQYIGIELNAEYIKIAEKRLAQEQLL